MNIFERLALIGAITIAGIVAAQANVYNPFSAGGLIPGCAISGGIVWNGGCGPAITDANGSITLGTNGPMLVNNSGQLRARNTNNTAYVDFTANNMIAANGVYVSGANTGVSCTVGTLNTATAIVSGGIIVHC